MDCFCFDKSTATVILQIVDRAVIQFLNVDSHILVSGPEEVRSTLQIIPIDLLFLIISNDNYFKLF